MVVAAGRAIPQRPARCRVLIRTGKSSPDAHRRKSAHRHERRRSTAPGTDQTWRRRADERDGSRTQGAADAGGGAAGSAVRRPHVAEESGLHIRGRANPALGIAANTAIFTAFDAL